MSDDSTRILSEGTEGYPLDPAAAAVEEQCPHCQTAIMPGEQFCPKCGYQRGTWREGEAGVEDEVAAAVKPFAASRFVLVSTDGSRYPLPTGESVIGRSAEADVTIGDGYISRLHARIAITNEGVSITDLGSANGTFIGDERLEPDTTTEIGVKTSLKLGQSAFALEEVEPESEAAEAESAVVVTEEDAERIPGELAEVHLEMKPALSPWQLKRTGTDEVFYLPFGDTMLGRKPDKCDMLVRGDSYISGRHCGVIASLEHLEMADLGSTNGTFVNGERCAPEQVVELRAGDILRVGSTDLEVAYEEQAEGSGDDGEALLDAVSDEAAENEVPEPDQPAETD